MQKNMKTYIVSLKFTKNNSITPVVLTGTFDSVYKSAKALIRDLDPSVRRHVYIVSIVES